MAGQKPHPVEQREIVLAPDLSGRAAPHVARRWLAMVFLRRFTTRVADQEALPSSTSRADAVVRMDLIRFSRAAGFLERDLYEAA